MWGVMIIEVEIPSASLCRLYPEVLIIISNPKSDASLWMQVNYLLRTKQ